ncbi:MAG: hypothetical protein M1530_00050, partial [Candidatus Marsarchaeota archaeon]|nr:hypothetical protein [Candidatus Marsarchaeota archaeon]
MEVIGKKLTKFEAIITMKTEKIPISLNSHFDWLLLKTDSKGNFRRIPGEMITTRPWTTGTAFAVGKTGEALSRPIEKEFTYNGEKKIAVFNRKARVLANADELLICEPKTYGETGYIELINLKSGKQILTIDALAEAKELEWVFSGPTKTFKIQNRNGGFFKTVEGKKTYSLVP